MSRKDNAQNAVHQMMLDIPGLSEAEYRDLYQFAEGAFHNFNMLNTRLSTTSKLKIATYLYNEGLIPDPNWSSVSKDVLQGTIQGNLRAYSGLSNLVDAHNLKFEPTEESKKLDEETTETVESSMDPQEAAYNAYYRDAYSFADDSYGKKIYDRLLESEQNAARVNLDLANAQLQQSAMQQAETVKAITDQVRAERMARLRAGMSEAQIANQDMQTMMTNINALNQQAAEYNLVALQAQQQQQLAQDTAYQQYLAQANAMSQTGAAYAASDAGDINQTALRIMQRIPGVTYERAIKMAQGQQ